MAKHKWEVERIAMASFMAVLLLMGEKNSVPA
jgi:hypothetical protein